MNNESREISIEELMDAVAQLGTEEKLEFDAAMVEREFIMKLVSTRKERGLTQTELANKTGLTQQVISTIEKCGRRPTLTNLIKYLIGLDLDINNVFTA